MISISANSPFPCIGCAHSGVCKYEESVMSFCRSNNPVTAVDCLSVEYRCKHQQKAYTSALRADQINSCSTTSKPYIMDSSSQCLT